MKKGIIYVAGPMRGYHAMNFKAFFAAQIMLEAEGWRVLNPAEEDVEELIAEAVKRKEPVTYKPKPTAMRDMQMLNRSDAIYMLDGWRQSDGARSEYYFAKMTGMEILYQTDDRIAIQKSKGKEIKGFMPRETMVGFTLGINYYFNNVKQIHDDQGILREQIDDDLLKTLASCGRVKILYE